MGISSGTSQASSPEGGVTPTVNSLALNPAAFTTLAEALNYAAGGRTGLNFHDARGRLTTALPYAELRRRALATARRLLGLGLRRGDRVAVLAETGPTFPEVFFACQYAGLVPVALPVSLHLGGREAFVEQLGTLLEKVRPGVIVTSPELEPLVGEGAASLGAVPVLTGEALATLPESALEPEPTRADEIAYLQFTSGSTRTPRGVVIRQRAVMSNLRGIIRHGLAIEAGDRCTSWLPFYHDMGMVGLLLGPVAAQRSVDYLGTREFAVRPLQWLKLLSRNGGTVAFAPPFGYDLCARRVRDRDLEQLDLSRWRVAGVGAEPIRPALLRRFAERLAPAGFRAKAFRACYGLAEASLAVTFASAGDGLQVERVDPRAMARHEKVWPAEDDGPARELVVCGPVLPEHEVVIRDGSGQPLPDGRIGQITVRGPSLMSGYDGDAGASRAALDADGWLYTGDLGYMSPAGLVVTGREKDLIIVHGRNIRPEDLEHLVERQPGMRSGDASAFAVDGADHGAAEGERVVIVVQCRLSDPAERAAFKARVEGLVSAHFGVTPEVDLVPHHTLPRTSSGKLSRAGARADYLARQQATPGSSTRTAG